MIDNADSAERLIRWTKACQVYIETGRKGIVAKKCKVTPQAVTKWFRNPQFLALLQHVHAEDERAFSRKRAIMRFRAADVYDQILSDPEHKDRFMVARDILSWRGLEVLELEHLQDRDTVIATIEAVLRRVREAGLLPSSDREPEGELEVDTNDVE